MVVPGLKLRVFFFKDKHLSGCLVQGACSHVPGDGLEPGSPMAEGKNLTSWPRLPKRN